MNKKCVKKSYKSTFLIYCKNCVNEIEKKNKITFIYFMVNFINFNSSFCNNFSTRK